MTTYTAVQSRISGRLTELRRDPRVPARGRVLISRGSISFVAQVSDLSASGARFTTTIEMIRPGHDLEAEMELSGGVVIPKVACRVRWMKRQPAGLWDIGVSFTDPTSVVKNRLSTYIAPFLPA